MMMMHSLAIAAFTLWLALNTLLWWIRPKDELWLLGSIAIFAAAVAFMMWYVTRAAPDG